MRTIRGEYIILIGFVMVVAGAVLPFLMVMRILPSTIFLNFFSYGASVMGLFLGLIGCAYFVRYRRSKNKDSQPPMETPDNHHQDW